MISLSHSKKSTMDILLDPQQKLRVLFYNLKMPVRRAKENMSRYGFKDLVFVSDESDLVNCVKGLDPHVIIINHHPWNESHTPALVEQLRATIETPVIIWSDNISEFVSRKLLSFKNTYTLRLSDGFVSLTEVLQRIEMKINNPGVWM